MSDYTQRYDDIDRPISDYYDPGISQEERLRKSISGVGMDFMSLKYQFVKGKIQKTNPIIIIAFILVLYGILKKR